MLLKTFSMHYFNNVLAYMPIVVSTMHCFDLYPTYKYKINQ